jgi:osmotically-inducible protein OsmY
MYERQAGQGRQDAARSSQRPPDTQLDESERSHRGEMTRQAPSSTERQEGAWEQGEQGGWTGYVVPYRYYGPGYRGVGYYSVMYQGSDEGEGQPQDEGRWQQSRSAGSQQPAGRWAGGFAGRGPKGYQRSDERIREEVSDRLMADDMIDASEIEVIVKQGEVTLKGSVDNRWAKRRVEDLAEQVMGVLDVMNQIRVEPGSGMSRQGATGTQRASSQSASNSSRTREQTASRSTDDQPTGTNGRRRATTTSR